MARFPSGRLISFGVLMRRGRNVYPNASCPFDPSICWNGDNNAYQMDTGPIDSHSVLGINAPEEDRVTYRRIVTCSVLNDTDRARLEIDPRSEGLNKTWARYYLGPTYGTRNFTYQYLAESIFSGFGYDIRVDISTVSVKGTWEPIPQLNRTDADVSLFFLTPNSLTYLAPVMDPWFSAHKAYFAVNNRKAWMPERYARIIGCADQHQLCSATDARICTRLGGCVQESALQDLRRLRGLNEGQILTGIRLWRLFSTIGIEGSLRWRGASALRAQDFVSSYKQSLPLPDNQWQIEISDWMAVSMAKLQQGVVDFAAGPNFLPKGLNMDLPDVMKPMCNSQKVQHSGGHISFSICGMTIILIVGGILILLSLVIDTVGGWCQNLIYIGRDRGSQWLVDEKLQLQRCAYERAGQGVWTGSRDAVPVTERGQLLGSLANPDENHSESSSWMVERGDARKQDVPLLKVANQFASSSTVGGVTAGGGPTESAGERTPPSSIMTPAG